MNTRTSLLLSIAVASVTACSAAPESTKVHEDRFSTTLSGESVHEDITASALDFLRPEVVSAVQAANVSVDVEFALVNANHFDDCNFTGGVAVIQNYQRQAVTALDPSDASPEADAAAMLAFGRWLHTAQDFYSHANFVEDGGDAIVEASLSFWASWRPYDRLEPSGFVLVQGKPPAKTSVTRRDDAPYPEDAVVRVKRARTTDVGVITGSVDYEPGDECPSSVEMAHDDLNKDKSTNVGREAQFRAADALAVEQTRHEWCRLVALARDAWGDAGATRLAAWVADPAGAACP